MSSKRNKVIGGIIAVVATAVAAGLLFFSPNTGANFSAGDEGRVTVETGTLSVELSDSDNAGTFTLDFGNMAPGVTKTDKFKVTNTGSIPASVKVGAPFSDLDLDIAGLQPADLAELKAGIPGHLSTTSVTNLTNSIPLGELQPGQSKWYTVEMSLDSAAGNEWQGQSAATDVTVTLKQ